METNAYVESSNKQGSKTQLSDRFYHDCLRALGGRTADAAMVLDDCGQVLYCNGEGAKILDSTPDTVAGKHIGEFVLNMRLNAWTPGSNVAYATFTGRRNQWREYCVLDSNGRGFPVELLLDVLVVNLRYLILLWVRKPARQACARTMPTEQQLEGVNV
ncbi:MAG: PAS domain-containing protein [Georgfuchsia sp.]